MAANTLLAILLLATVAQSAEHAIVADSQLFKSGKSQLRITMTPQPVQQPDSTYKWQSPRGLIPMTLWANPAFAPYAVGDSIRITEPWRIVSLNHKDTANQYYIVSYKTGNQPLVIPEVQTRFKPYAAQDTFRRDTTGMYYAGKWRTAETMPEWASRVSLKITRVRVQQAQEITLEDAIAEDGSAEVVFPFDAGWRYQKLYGMESWERNEWAFLLSLDNGPVFEVGETWEDSK